MTKLLYLSQEIATLVRGKSHRQKRRESNVSEYAREYAVLDNKAVMQDVEAQLETVLQGAQESMEKHREEKLNEKMQSAEVAHLEKAAALARVKELEFEMSRLRLRNQELEQSLLHAHDSHQTTLRILSNRERGHQIPQTDVDRYTCGPHLDTQSVLALGNLNSVESIKARLMQDGLELPDLTKGGPDREGAKQAQRSFVIPHLPVEYM